MEELVRLLELLRCVKDTKELENLRVAIGGKNGVLTSLFKELKDMDEPLKKEQAAKINKLKKDYDLLLESKKSELESLELDKAMAKESLDASLFNATTQFYTLGTKQDSNLHMQSISEGHPIHRMQDIIIDYFTNLNFSLEDGPLIEDDFHNFEALNLPKYHPARDMQDTFYFKDSRLLRTHTSPIQIRTMESKKPPLRMICTGPTFRRDYDLTHSPMFHQVEGLVVEEGDNISFANLKYLLEDFLKFIFGSETEVRFRSSFFPFTEPSAEVDISCVFCKGKGCRVCSQTGWLEVLGCGIVDSNVFKAVGYEGVSGYAFGLGVERLAMLKWGIGDLRSFFETDLRLLEQF
ncbi:phenylalanine--tRNA ligase subunit alpha [Helicobacter sp. 13S00401-1]|uniref:phenylalanine--tRNA ligase subunit alpha n=1 Tax=Helicobacter sp. 13S00401-1 TaxID=1905758 RepID=UPI000BA51B49|nr:phenylalanine--tRNA ligase subunit alpha [Helicobacter sp. 13S00401-1]PAF51818.1 phenylalanine--tRNA ligase subunit alpha [Helicobacter sp. 13S00401-1]